MLRGRTKGSDNYLELKCTIVTDENKIAQAFEPKKSMFERIKSMRLSGGKQEVGLLDW